jgi:hypothetical protein
VPGGGIQIGRVVHISEEKTIGLSPS